MANPTNLRRAQLLPVEQWNPTPDLIQALWEYHAARGQRVTLAWTMIQTLHQKVLSTVNLPPMNTLITREISLGSQLLCSPICRYPEAGRRKI
jgi:adenine C2-methylase RlmN of 23S rRNA A2503 and tRNA A37